MVAAGQPRPRFTGPHVSETRGCVHRTGQPLGADMRRAGTLARLALPLVAGAAGLP